MTQTIAIKVEAFDDSQQIVFFQEPRIKTVHVTELFLELPMVKFPCKFCTNFNVTCAMQDMLVTLATTSTNTLIVAQAKIVVNL